jgi:hypothetical protein
LQDIITELYKSREIDDCINKLIPAQDRDDFKQELFLILLEKQTEEIVRIDQTGKMLYYVVRIIINLSRQQRNVYHSKYRDKKIAYDQAS